MVLSPDIFIPSVLSHSQSSYLLPYSSLDTKAYWFYLSTVFKIYHNSILPPLSIGLQFKWYLNWVICNQMSTPTCCTPSGIPSLSMSQGTNHGAQVQLLHGSCMLFNWAKTPHPGSKSSITCPTVTLNRSTFP